jgi:hypothetical protein
MAIDTKSFLLAFSRFAKLVEAHDRGHKFTNFREGLAAVWEGYKPRLRDHALGLLAAESWDPGAIGQGPILERAIAAIEIQDSRKNLTNNLVFWQNRFGHATRDHRAFRSAT